MYYVESRQYSFNSNSNGTIAVRIFVQEIEWTIERLQFKLKLLQGPFSTSDWMLVERVSKCIDFNQNNSKSTGTKLLFSYIFIFIFTFHHFIEDLNKI
jgi:hypothetical protein